MIFKYVLATRINGELYYTSVCGWEVDDEGIEVPSVVYTKELKHAMIFESDVRELPGLDEVIIRVEMDSNHEIKVLEIIEYE